MKRSALDELPRLLSHSSASFAPRFIYSTYPFCAASDPLYSQGGSRKKGARPAGRWPKSQGSVALLVRLRRSRFVALAYAAIDSPVARGVMRSVSGQRMASVDTVRFNPPLRWRQTGSNPVRRRPQGQCHRCTCWLPPQGCRPLEPLAVPRAAAGGGTPGVSTLPSLRTMQAKSCRPPCFLRPCCAPRSDPSKG